MVRVEPGIHHIAAKTRVHVTLYSNSTSGTFADGSDILNYDFTEDEPVLNLPEVKAKEGWEFIGWTVAGQNPQVIDKAVKSINVMDYADFTYDNKNGTLSIFAVYKQAEKTVNVYFSLNKDMGEFEGNTEAESLSYENLTENKIALPKVNVKEGYVFTGWKGYGKEEIVLGEEAVELENLKDIANFDGGFSKGVISLEAQFAKEVTPIKKFVTANFNTGDNGAFEDGSNTQSTTILEDESCQIPSVKAKEGYAFTGWKVEGKETTTFFKSENKAEFVPGEFAFFYHGAGNVTLTAQYEAVPTEEKTVNVYFNVDPEKGCFTNRQEQKS